MGILQDLQGFQGFQDNRVLWILQILFMMLGCLRFFLRRNKPLFSDQFRRGVRKR